MGLLDSVVGQVVGAALGQQGGGSGALGGLVNELIGGQGGLANLAAQFAKNGLGEQVQSWISSGQNLPVSGAQITQALGNDVIGRFAGQLGLSQEHTADQLAGLLPGLIDKLTPGGALPADGTAPAAGLGGLLKGLLGQG